MAFNLFKRKEKEIIEDNNAGNSKDIVSDFGNFVNNQMSPNMNEKNTISSFDNNYNESITSEFENNLKPNKVVNISNNFESSYGENIDNDNNNIFPTPNTLNNFQNNEERVVRNFNPYLNEVESDTSINIPKEQPKLEEQPNMEVLPKDYNPIMNDLEQIPNSIKNSQDINIAMSNIMKKEKEESLNDSSPNNNDNQTQTNINLNDVDPGYKRCPKCGQKIREDYKQCFVCGTMFN